MSAIRVARGVTGREKIIKMAGHYHGHVDSLLIQAGSAATTLGTPNSPGVTAGAAKDTLLCPFNNAEAIEETLSRDGVAARLVSHGGGLKLFALAGYYQREDERLARAPGRLTGVIGAAPTPLDL